ncbi:MAG: phosphate ABC transporter substrate-binding protein PstS [Novosphingobium sp.]|nr:phosphate ABC transporter substrate-binding protein PstS [Novosphingobium sp.]
MKKKMSWPLAIVATVAALGGATAYAAENITGAGSTFVFPILSKWAADYSNQTGDHINYQSIGSGGGIAQIKAATVDFGASDKPLAPEELAQAGLAQFPLVIGGVVPVYNLTGTRPGQLRFSGPVLADIYLGRITKWNDPNLVRLNPGVRLPATTINVVHRSDGSGTTFNFVHYLSQVSGDWRGKVGEGTAVQWPTGVGGKGNEGVSAYVKQIPNSIGYVEYAYALQNKMAFGQVQNAAGRFIMPNARSFQAAAAHANWGAAKDFYLVMTNAAGPDSYPITATVFIMMYKHPKNPVHSAAALKFFRWALAKGQPQAASLDYVPFPPTVVNQINRYIAAEIK